MTALDGRRIELWVEARGRRPAVNPVMRGLLTSLRAAGADTRVRVIERHVATPDALAARGGPDLVLMRSFGPLALSVASVAERHGRRFLNSAARTIEATDKPGTLATLAAAGLPVPTTWLRAGRAGPHVAEGDELDRNGWYTKPVIGIHGDGVRHHPGPTPPLMRGESRPELVQRAVGSGPDVKVYVAGNAVFAGRKWFGPLSYASDRIRRIEPDDELVRLALMAAEALALSSVGLDIREGPEGRVIVDANPFPGFRGFPEAVPFLHALVARHVVSST